MADTGAHPDDVDLDEEDDALAGGDPGDDDADDGGANGHDKGGPDDAGAGAGPRREHRAPADVLAEMAARAPTVMELATTELAQSGQLPPVTARFLACAKGNEAEARKRWAATLEWRVQERMNDILREPQPDFDKIKQYYPHFYHGRSRQGHQVYYELPGRVNLRKLHASGVTFESLLRYYLFSAEFLQSVLIHADDGKSITVFDCAGLAMRKVPRDVKQFMSTANALMSEHFPERAFKVFVVNVPVTFSVLWRVASGFIDPVTRSKISVVRGKKAVFKALSEHIAPDQLPARYGGSCPDDLGHAPEELLLGDLVHALGSP